MRVCHSQQPCDPAMNWQDGISYCTDYQSQCQVDCQTVYSSDGNQENECYEYRCDDVSQYTNDGEKCYSQPPPNGYVSNPVMKFDCWASQQACQICPQGYELIGCSRVSPGSCQQCSNYAKYVLHQNYYPPNNCTLKNCPPDGNDTPECPTCTAPQGSYWSAIGSQPCSENNAWSACDECTLPLVYIVTVNACPQFDNTSGRNATGSCLPCQACPAGKYYEYDSNAKLKCMTDPATQCYSYVNISGKLIASGPMPFLFGYQRKAGILSSDINYNEGDTLPRYVNCSAFPGTGYVKRNPMNTAISYDTTGKSDCNISLVCMCDTGYYAVLQSVSQAVQCLKCPNAPRSPGGMQTTCTCPDGHATSSELSSGLLGSIVTVSPQAPEYCYDCTEDIFIGGNKEYVACTVQGGVHRCTAGQYMNSTTNQCVGCPVGAIVLPDRSGCIPCAAGTYLLNYQCVACNPENNYCPYSGMTVPLNKKLSCPAGAGQMLLANLTDPLRDNTCVACTSCADGDLYVYEQGHNASNGCSITMADNSELYFFSCYNAIGEGINPQVTKAGYKVTFSPQTNSYGNIQNTFVVSECTGLPSYAQWVTPPSYNGLNLACMFSCLYGSDDEKGSALQSAVQNLVYNGTRADLYDFLHSMENPSYAAYASEVVSYELALYPSKDSTASYLPQWKQQVSTSCTLDLAHSKAYYLQNTFILLDEVPPPTGLCLAPPPQAGQPCPLGFDYAASDSTPTACALLAAQNGLYSVTLAGDSTLYYAVLNSAVIQCLIEQAHWESDAWIYYTQCEACTDMALAEVSSCTLMNMCTAQESVAIKWLTYSSWPTNVPYGFKTAGSCTSGMLCSGFNVPFIVEEGVTACIPCNAPSSDWSSVCGLSLTFDAGKCMTAGSVEQVCVACNITDGVAGLIHNPADIASWIGTTSGWAASNSVCKYYCATNYTSNPNAQTYSQQPCLSCKSVIDEYTSNKALWQVDEAAYYFDYEQQYQECGDHFLHPASAFELYTPNATQCSPMIGNEIKFSANILASSNGACPALCNPIYYFTYAAQNGNHTTTPVPQQEITSCVLCTSEHVLSCNTSLCIAKYYRFCFSFRIFTVFFFMFGGTGMVLSVLHAISLYVINLSDSTGAECI